MKAIEVKELGFKYLRGKEPSLKKISFQQGSGEAVAICGRSGAGKSSFLFCLNRIIPNFYPGDFSGEIEILGQSISGKKTYELAQSVGMVLQDFEAQLFSSRAELDVAFGPENLGLERGEISRRIEKALSAVGMENFRHRAPDTLSGGEKQRLAIASVLALEPEILLFDEATTDLDPIGREQVWEVMRNLKKQGKTIIFVENEPEGIAQSERMVIFDQGEIVREGKTSQLLAEPEILKKYGIRPPEIAELFSQLNISPLETDPKQAGKILKEKGFKLNPSQVEKLKEQDREKCKKENRAIIEVSSLEHIYPAGHQALSGIDLKVFAGDFLAIIGQNGSGKTTLVKHFNGLLTPSSGEIRFKGEKIKSGMVSELGKAIGFVFQNPDHQIFSNTVYDEVAFAPRNYGLSEEEVKSRVEFALELVGLKGREQENPFLMTKGERQRLAIAGVLSSGAEVLILDEPTTGLDYQEQVRVMELLKKLHQEGHTIIIITHTLWLVANYAQRAVVLSGGEKILEGTVREVLSQPELLARASLKPSAITELGLELGFGFLRVEEAVQVLEKEK